MPDIDFYKIDPFSFFCRLDGKPIGMVIYSPAVCYSWTFCNAGGTVRTFGSTKYQAVKNYVTLFLQKEAV